MLQVRKSHFCGISAIFLQCCFISETQVIMTVSNFFLFFFSMINFLEGCFTFQWGASFFSGGCPMEGGGINFDGGILKKKSFDGGGAPSHAPPHYGKHCIYINCNIQNVLKHLECFDTQIHKLQHLGYIATFEYKHYNYLIYTLQQLECSIMKLFRVFNRETVSLCSVLQFTIQIFN